jgi:hypothetical protein
MSTQSGASAAHPYNTDKWTFEASPEVKSQSDRDLEAAKKVKPVALKEVPQKKA